MQQNMEEEPSENGAQDVLTCSKNKDEPLFDEPSFAGAFRADFEDEISLMPKSRPI
jgi:hypothetical protein